MIEIVKSIVSKVPGKNLLNCNSSITEGIIRPIMRNILLLNAETENALEKHHKVSDKLYNINLENNESPMSGD